MRLALVTETFPPEVNGVARTLERWVNAFVERGHNVCLIRPRQAHESWAEVPTIGVPLPFYPELRCGIASRESLRRALQKANAELVHIATEGPLGLAALAACKQGGIPVASSFHTNFDHYLTHYRLGFLRPICFAYLRWFHNQGAVTLVPSEGTRRRLLRSGFRRVEIWTRGVDCHEFSPCRRDAELRRMLGLTEYDILLLYVGRLAAEKNLDVLLEVFGNLRRRLGRARLQVRLALVGSGPLAAALARRALAGLVLPGVQRGLGLARWYASADVFVFPSRSETFGNVILEAKASGLPVVAFDSPGVNEQVDGATGLLVSTPGEMETHLRQLIHDRGARCRLGHGARQNAEQQAWEPIFDGLEQRYQQLLETRNSTLASGGAWPRARGCP